MVSLSTVVETTAPVERSIRLILSGGHFWKISIVIKIRESGVSLSLCSSFWNANAVCPLSLGRWRYRFLRFYLFLFFTKCQLCQVSNWLSGGFVKHSWIMQMHGGEKWGSHLLSFSIREVDPHLKVWKEADGVGPGGRKCQGGLCWQWGAETCSVGSEQILLLNRGMTVIILLLQFSRERKAINSERHSGTIPLRPQRENENKGERTRERARGRKMVYKAFCFDNGMQAH